MAIGVIQPQLLSMDQAAPVLYGADKGTEILKNLIAARYAAPLLQQKLRQQQLANAILQAKSAIAPQVQEALLKTSQANIFSSPPVQYQYQEGLYNQQSPSDQEKLAAVAPPSSASMPQGAGQMPGGSGAAGVPAFMSKYSLTNEQIAEQQALGQARAAKRMELIKDANSEANESAQAANDLARYREAMQKTDLKGGILGRVPGWLEPSGEAQNADQAVHSLLFNYIREGIKGGKVTNADANILMQGKLSRELYDKSSKKSADLLGAVIARRQSYPQFVNEYLKQGGDPLQTEAAWNAFQQKNPLYIEGKGVQKQNAADWQGFLPGQSGQAQSMGESSGQPQNLPLTQDQIDKLKKMMAGMGSMGSSGAQDTKVLNGKTYVKKNGAWHEL